MENKLEARSEGEQRDVARLLDGKRDATLVASADTGQPARNDLAPLGNEALQQAHIAVADRIDLLGAELADLLAPEEFAAAWATRTACAGTARARAGAMTR